jgi:hypothetical protein
LDAMDVYQNLRHLQDFDLAAATVHGFDGRSA